MLPRLLPDSHRHHLQSYMIIAFWSSYGLPWGSVVKIRLPVQETLVQSLGQEDPLERKKWQPTLVFFPGKFCGLRSPAVYSQGN